ncbi:MAG TPA: hypothetical protein VFI25_11920 [Planctomycetota bacterium]|jgi:hypothetical protein|nr:hypothetical protein [Planctomycetota bacterium]
MKDRRVCIVANTSEARFPGVQVVVEPYGSPDDETIRWWVYILHCRRKDLRTVRRFAIGLGLDLFRPGMAFIADARERWDTALFLARKKKEARAARRTGRLRRKTA